MAGIGRAICVELAKEGIDIFFSYWSEYDKDMPWNVEENEPDLIQQEIRNLASKCEKFEIDLSKSGSIKVLLDEVKIKLGKPQILINNATYSTETTIENISATELD